MRPFLKWAGGKQRLLEQLKPLLPSDYADRRHVEPFVGGGALFFAMEPRTALLNDANIELINVYGSLGDGCYGSRGAVLEHLALLEQDCSEAAYYRAREHYNRASASALRAALFLYLNKTCFNGLYRINGDGLFNVPWGKYVRPTFDWDVLHDVGRLLEHAEITSVDFSQVSYRDRDFIYFDPPYAPLSPTSSFTAYTEEGFGKADQERLRDFWGELDATGKCRLMMSNSDTPYVRELYSGFPILTVQAPRAINSAGSKRGNVSELVIRNY